MNGLQPDWARLEDLAEFAAIELEANDVEPWAMMLGELRSELPVEDVAWLVTLYNTYDSLGSAWEVYRRWPSIGQWYWAADQDDAQIYPCTQERRNLRGGRVLKRMASYADALYPDTEWEDQMTWLARPLTRGEPQRSFADLTAHLRTIWGVGRQSAFEWAEFCGKSLGLPVTAGDAQLWESEGPRRSLQKLYGNAHPDRAWLDAAAHECISYLRSTVDTRLTIEDFETIICDFNVMRDGRYYPGRHLAALREEIEELTDPAGRDLLRGAFARVAPGRWAKITPGINPLLMPIYRQTGQIVRTP